MHHLDNLARRIRSGDPVALRELRRELEGGLPTIVRHTLRTRQAISPVHRYILTEAGRLTPRDGDDSPRGQEWLVRQVVRRLCDLLVGGLRPGHERTSALETVRH